MNKIFSLYIEYFSNEYCVDQFRLSKFYNTFNNENYISADWALQDISSSMVSSRSQTASSTGTGESRNDLPYRSYYSTSELNAEGGAGTNSGPASLSMAVDIHNLVGSPSASVATHSPDPEGPPSVTLGASKSDPEEEEESYEGFGYGDGDSPGSSAPSPTRSNPPR